MHAPNFLDAQATRFVHSCTLITIGLHPVHLPEKHQFMFEPTAIAFIVFDWSVLLKACWKGLQHRMLPALYAIPHSGAHFPYLCKTLLVSNVVSIRFKSHSLLA